MSWRSNSVYWGSDDMCWTVRGSVVSCTNSLSTKGRLQETELSKGAVPVAVDLFVVPRASARSTPENYV
jgi:hypothetical protein